MVTVILTQSDYGDDGDNDPVITDMVDDTVYELIPENISSYTVSSTMSLPIAYSYM